MRRAIFPLLLNFSKWLMPRPYAEWSEAMIAECNQPTLSDEQRLTWAGGCALAALQMRIRYADLTYFGVALSVIAALIYLDWHTSSDVPTLSVLIITAAVLGYLRPRRFYWTALLTGECLLAAHAFTVMVDRWLPSTQCGPLDWTYWLINASVIIPAGVGALIGRSIRSLNSSGRGSEAQ